MSLSMCKKSLVIVCLLVGIQNISWAQLNIVGVNTNAPETQVDYLNHPIQMEKYFKKYDGLSNVFEAIMPENQLFYHTENNYYVDPSINDFFQLPPAFSFQGDSLVLGFPSGYFRIVGMYNCYDELKSIKKEYNKRLSLIKKFYYQKDTSVVSNVYFYNTKGSLVSFEDVVQNEYNKLVDKYTVQTAKDWTRRYLSESSFFFDKYDSYTYKSLQEMINTQSDPKIRVLFWIIEDASGKSFCIPSDYFAIDDRSYDVRENTHIMVDYVNNLIDKYKGQYVVFNYDGPEYSTYYVTDYYSDIKIPITPLRYDLGYERTISEFVKLVETFPSTYYCKDIVIDNNRILAVFDDGKGTSFSLPLKPSNAKWNYKIENPDNYKEILFRYSFDMGVVASRERYYLVTKKMTEPFKRDYATGVSVVKSHVNKSSLEQKKAQEERKKKLVSKYGEKLANTIVNHKLDYGMTPEMCVESIGYPTHYYKDSTPTGVALVYAYAFMNVYFYDNKLVRIEEGF